MGAIDLQRALSDPSGMFRSPDAVARHPDLTREEKIRILRNWKLDSSRLVESEGEGMMGGDPPILRRVTIALESVLAAR